MTLRQLIDEELDLTNFEKQYGQLMQSLNNFSKKTKNVYNDPNILKNFENLKNQGSAIGQAMQQAKLEQQKKQQLEQQQAQQNQQNKQQQQDQQNREPKIGDGNANLRQTHHAHITQFVVARCCVDTR